MQIVHKAKAFFLPLFCLTLLSAATAQADRPVPEAILHKFVEFPVPNNPDLAYPDGVTLGPDGNLYVGFFGNVFLPETESYFKGVGRVFEDGSVELIAEFPSPGGLVEELVFGPDGNLYVTVTRYNNVDAGLLNGIVKVDVENKTFTQFYGDPDLPDANGLVLDCEGNFYLSQPDEGKIHKIDSEGNASLWIQNELLEGTGLVSPSGQVNGVQGMEIDNKRRVIYGGNFDKSTIVEIPINDDGSAGEPFVLFEHPELLSIDTIGSSFDQKTLFASMLTTGTVAQIDLRGHEPSLHILVENSEIAVPIKTIPLAGFDDESVQNWLVVTDAGLLDGTQGRIWFLEPDCPGHSKCSFYRGPVKPRKDCSHHGKDCPHHDEDCPHDCPYCD